MSVIWIFGRPNAGKTTVAKLVAQQLGTLLLDSDLVRQVLGVAPDFSVDGRTYYQNRLRKYVSKLSAQGHDVIVASITPLESMRQANRELLTGYFDIYLKCSFEAAKERDQKGLYEKAHTGLITEFTGVDSPFEEPTIEPFLIVDTTNITVETTVNLIIKSLEGHLCEY